jgi:hypothetical protein
MQARIPPTRAAAGSGDPRRARIDRALRLGVQLVAHSHQPQYVLARSQLITPAKASPSNALIAVAARLPRNAKTVNVWATNVHSQAFIVASLVGDSSPLRCG